MNFYGCFLAPLVILLAIFFQLQTQSRPSKTLSHSISAKWQDLLARQLQSWLQTLVSALKGSFPAGGRFGLFRCNSGVHFTPWMGTYSHSWRVQVAKTMRQIFKASLCADTAIMWWTSRHLALGQTKSLGHLPSLSRYPQAGCQSDQAGKPLARLRKHDPPEVLNQMLQ